MPIRRCRDKRTARFLAGEHVREFQGFAEAAAKALTKLQAATVLGDLLFPPSNNFEALSGDRKGQYSIRINRRYRVCFTWVVTGSAATNATTETDLLKMIGDADNVEITDYH